MQYNYNLPYNNMQFGQVYNPQIQLFSSSSQSKPMISNLSSCVYDSSLLNGTRTDFIPENSKVEETVTKPQKIKERKSSFTSTCKSTAHSHQENTPALQCNSEEVKQEFMFIKANKEKSGIYLSIKDSRGKSLKQRQLEFASKQREPLSVRRINRNFDDLCSNIENQFQNASILYSTLPTRCLKDNLLSEILSAKSQD